MGKKTLQWDWYWLSSQKKKIKKLAVLTYVSLRLFSVQVFIFVRGNEVWSAVKALETPVLHFLRSGCPVKWCHQLQGRSAGFLPERETQWFRMWGDWGPINLVSRDWQTHPVLAGFPSVQLQCPCQCYCHLVLPWSSPFSRRNSAYWLFNLKQCLFPESQTGCLSSPALSQEGEVSISHMPNVESQGCTV